MTSIRDVAREAGVSVTTVSLVMNNKGHISKRTREKVLRVVEELNYTRANGNSYRRKEARIIGFAQRVARGLADPTTTALMQAIVRQVEAAERRLLVFSEDTIGEDELENYHQLIATERVDGFVLTSVERDDPRFNYLHRRNIPFVAFGRSYSAYDDEVHWVDIDDAHGICRAVAHLAEEGHQRIAIICWRAGSTIGDERFLAYQRALADHTLYHDDNLVIRTQDSVRAGYEAAEQLFERANPPTAIVTFSDVLAAGALRYLQATGQQAAVTGYDDSSLARVTLPALTTVRLPIDEAAALLLEQLVAQIERREPEDDQRNWLLKPELVIRESSMMRDVAQ